MPEITPPARFDLPWKAALTHAFRAFMRFYFPDLCDQIDWSKRPRFRDKELAGSGFGGAAGVMVADKLVEVCLHAPCMQAVLIHVEVQAQRDPALARRMFDYNYRIFTEHGKPVLSLVLLADDDPHWRPDTFHNQLPGTLMGIWFSVAKLQDYAARTDMLKASHNPIAWVTLAHLCTQQAHHDPKQLYKAKLDLTAQLFQHRWSKRRIMVLFKVVNWMMALPKHYQERYLRAVIRLERTHKMELFTPLEQMLIDKGWEKGLKKGIQQGREQGLEQGLERGLEQGLERGLEQGLEQGRREGAIRVLERQLARRFGPLSKTVRNRLAKASLEQIDAWSDSLPEAQSLKQVLD